MRNFRMIGETPHATDLGEQSSPAGRELPVDEEVVAAIIPREHGGRGGLEPTRYGDWEKDGRCIDF